MNIKSYKKMFKYIVVYLAISMVCGCTPSQNGSIQIEEITLWTSQSHSYGIDMNIFKNYNRTKGKADGIKINSELHMELTDKELAQAYAADAFPDFVTKEFNNEKLPYWAPISDLPGSDEFLKPYIEKYSDYLKTYECSKDGKIYVIPIGCTTSGLVYNKDMFEAAGIVDDNGNARPPETFDEMRDIAKKLTNVKKGEYGIIFPMAWGDDAWFRHDIAVVMTPSLGYERYNQTKGKWCFESLEPAINMVLGMKHDGSIYPGSETLDNETARATFSNGGVGMKFASSFDVGVYNYQYPAAIKWGVAPFPTVDKNVKHSQRMAYEGSYIMSKSAVKKRNNTKLMKAFEFFCSDERMAEKYKNCVSIPLNENIIKSTTPNNSIIGWKEFVNIVNISENPYVHPLIMPEDSTYAGVVMKELIYPEKLSPKEGLELIDKVMNRSMEEFYAQNPEEDITAYQYGEINKR